MPVLAVCLVCCPSKHEMWVKTKNMHNEYCEWATSKGGREIKCFQLKPQKIC